MRHSLSTVVFCIASAFSLSHSAAADDKEQILFDFADESAAKDWAPVKLPEVKDEQPSPKIEFSPTDADDGKTRRGLKLTFAGGDWPAVETTKIPVQGNWKQFQT